MAKHLVKFGIFQWLMFSIWFIRTVIKTKEKESKASKRVELILDSAPTACFLINKNFEAIDCNLAAVSLFGVSNKLECIHSFYHTTSCENCASKQCKTDECELRASFNKALTGGSSKTEWFLKIGENRSIHCSFSFARLEYNDDYVVAAYIEDLSIIRKVIEDAKKLELAEESSLAKSRFLARMSHEIRTPITAVMGISEIQLQNPNLPLDIEEAFAKIYDSARILYGILGDVLDISKIEAGKVEIVIAKYEFQASIVDVMQIHFMQLGGKNIKFVVDVDENIPVFLLGDELHLKQALNNILSNAVKYTERGSITIEVKCDYLGGENENDDVNLVIRVADTGCGMSAEQIREIQNEYMHFHIKENRFTQGTGLGMPIVYSLVELMKGSIKIESEVGVGTAVTLRLPQKIASSEKLGNEAARQLERVEDGLLSRKLRIDFEPEPMPYGSVLIVDDVDANIYVAKGLMGFYGLNIESASSGMEAIKKIEAGRKYDIIFMDHMMPELDGFEATKILRERGYNEPIVAFTANAVIGQADEFLKNGFDGFISKPIRAAHLNTILNKFVRDKQSDETLQRAKENTVLKPDSTIITNYLEENEVSVKLRRDFLRTKRNALREIDECLEKSDIKTAHRLAHNLKGLAGLIGEHTLLSLAQSLENSLKLHGVPGKMYDKLKQEMEAVIKRLEAVHVSKPPPEKKKEFNKAKTTLIFNVLEELMNENKIIPADLLGSLESTPEAEGLVSQIEDFDYAGALETVTDLRKKLEL